MGVVLHCTDNFNHLLSRSIKVEKILECKFSENSNYGRENLLEVERQNNAGNCRQTLENKKFVDITQ